MLTYRHRLYKGKKFNFFIYGTSLAQTTVSKYIEKTFSSEKESKKLVNVLKAIDTDPQRYSNDEKFKRLEDDVWEIKISAIRIACIWERNKTELTAIYGFNKKTQEWSAGDLNKMRREKVQYRDS